MRKGENTPNVKKRVVSQFFFEKSYIFMKNFGDDGPVTMVTKVSSSNIFIHNLDLPAIVVTTPDELILRILWLPGSAINIFPSLSMATPSGFLNFVLIPLPS